MANMKDVAEEAGVSVTTVSHVINDTRYVSPELTNRVENAIEKLDYRPDLIAKGLKQGNTNTIGLVISEISNPFYPRVVKGVEDYAREHNHSLMLFNTDEEPVEEKNVISFLQSQRVSGFILSSTIKDPGSLISMIEKESNYVLIDRKLDNISADQIYSNNHQGAYDAIKHLIEYDHDKIGAILGPTDIKSVNRRLKGYKSALRDHNISINEDYIIQSGLELEGAYISTRKLLNNGPEVTAIFSANNIITRGVFHYLKDHNIKCPKDIALIGFDDPDWAKLVHPTISSVAQKPYRMGYKAAEVLFQRINEKNRDKYKVVELATKLIKRESTTGIENRPIVNEQSNTSKEKKCIRWCKKLLEED